MKDKLLLRAMNHMLRCRSTLSWGTVRASRSITQAQRLLCRPEIGTDAMAYDVTTGMMTRGVKLRASIMFAVDATKVRDVRCFIRSRLGRRKESVRSRSR
jgi:hypothetical protein